MRILIIKLSSLGDLFHALPAVHNLQTELNATIDWVTNTGYTDLVGCFDDVDRVIAFPRKNFAANFFRFHSELSEKQYDMIIDMQGLLKSALTARLARGKRRIGPSFHREGSRLFYNSVAGERNRQRHAVIENLDIIRHLNLPQKEINFPVTFPTYSKVSEVKQLSLLEVERSVRPPKVAICPTSRWQSKNWPAKNFAETARRLQQNLHASITLLGGPDDIEICNSIENELELPCNNLAGKTSLVEMGSVLKEMELLIANDSGPAHMAAAIDTPTLVIFGPTDPNRVRPFGNESRHQILKTAYPCQPCHSRTKKCENPDIPCITGVKIYQVVDKASEMLKQIRAAE